MTSKKVVRKGAAKAGAKKAGARAGAKKAGAAQAASGKKRVEVVDGGRYVRIDGRRWRATDPGLPEEERARLVSELMRARRDVGRALRAGDTEAEREARGRVNDAKVALGERGPKWWERGAGGGTSRPDDGGEEGGR